MRPRLFLPLLAILVALPVSAATISGTVNPAGMTVAAYDAGGSFVVQTTADSSGHYALTVSAGSYHLLAYDPAGVYATSFYPDADSFESSTLLNVTGDLTNINFTLVKGGFIAGTVTSAGGDPLANMTVAVYNLNGTRRGFTKTSSTGRYLLVVPPGAYVVAAYDDTLKYVTTFFNNQETFASASRIGIGEGVTVTANFALAESVHITGTVTDVSGAPLSDIVVNAYNANGSITGTTTNASGQYQLSVRTGTYRIVFEDPAGVYAAVYYVNAESFSTSTPVSAPAANVNAAMTRGGRISGSVTPSSNVVVVAYNADGTVRTMTFATNGQYSLLVPPGDYSVGAFDNSLAYAPQFFSQQPLFGNASMLHAVSGVTVSNINFALHAGGRFSGLVTDRITSVPIEGITVAAYDGSGTLYGATNTKADGSYRFVVEPGIYKLVASDDSQRYATAYAANAVNFETSPSISVGASQEIADANFAMVLAAKVAGIATDAQNGSPISGIVIDAFDTNGNRVARLTTPASGSVSFALPPGTYKFVASDPVHRYATAFYLQASSYDTATPVTVNSGASISVSFSMGLATSTGQVRHRAVRH